MGGCQDATNLKGHAIKLLFFLVAKGTEASNVVIESIPTLPIRPDLPCSMEGRIVYLRLGSIGSYLLCRSRENHDG